MHPPRIFAAHIFYNVFHLSNVLAKPLLPNPQVNNEIVFSPQLSVQTKLKTAQYMMID